MSGGLEPASVLHAIWAAEAGRVGWTPQRLQHAALVVLQDPVTPDRRTDRPLPTVAPTLAPTLEEVLPRPARDGQKGAVAQGRDEQVVLAALQAAGVRAAVFSRAEVAGQVAAHLPTDGLTAAQVLARVEVLTDTALRLAEAVPVGQPIRGVTPRRSDPRYATVQVLQAEARILDLAGRGRGAGYGKVRPTVLWPALDSAAANNRLDSGQYRAVLHLAGDGDFLSVLTAPAGAGKTSTLGAASRAWAQAGYRVVGLAPSARAAAELAAATGSRSDTLAKWLHNHDHLAQLPEQERARTRLDDRTVLVVDEASMASTLDLDRLTAAAGRAAAKVVLVGDPGQIGVINGPGGMLSALAHAGHGVELEQIHRFAQQWEREASLALRKADPAVLGVYRSQDRLHPCATGDQAVDALFSHWTQARHEGQDPLMLARTRLDVDALNTRARTAALTEGQITGPVTTAGERDWQAGDLLRTRRNNRHLTLGHAGGQYNGQDSVLPGQGSGHVRNGDRFRVLGPGPDGGLIVEDLTGRGRVVLPVDYLAEHCEYGWALTIDAAQGATCDLGLVLVRPGVDREHLYVGMTRGRNGNHAYITPDTTVDPEHDQAHNPRGRQQPDRDLQREAHGVLTAALAQSGAQDAAHTALAQARKVAADTARKQQERQAADAEQQRLLPQPVPAEHTRAVEHLQALRAERDQLHQQQRRLWANARDTKQQLDAAPKWARGRRQTLTSIFTEIQGQLQETHPSLANLDTQIQEQTRLVDSHTRQRDDEKLDQQRRDDLGALRRRAPNDLALPRPTQDQVRDLATRLAASRSRDDDDFYLHSHDNDRGLSR
jgi:ATP-dependent exoDNAse (exonuclease V) alpha subunit